MSTVVVTIQDPLSTPPPTSVTEVGTDSSAISGTVRGPSPVVNTDGDRGDRIFVGDARPETLGKTPISGDIYIGDPPAGATRPDATTYGVGGEFYDTLLHKPIWSDGTIWRDAMGTPV